MVAGKRQTAWPKHSEQSKCERDCETVAMASAGVGMCGGLLRRALTFAFGAGSKFRMRSAAGRGWSRLPGARGCLPPELEGRSDKVKPAP